MTRSAKLVLSVDPYEVVFGPRPLRVSSPIPLDRQSAASALSLVGCLSTLRWTEGDRTVTISPVGGLCPGRHVLQVGELISARGRRISTPTLSVPFFAVEGKARLSSRMRALNVVRLRFNRLGTERLRADRGNTGSFVDIVKAIDRKTGKPTIVAFDHHGRRIDLARRWQDLFARQRKAFGKLEPQLKRMAEETGMNKRIRIAVWLSVGRTELPDKRSWGVTHKQPQHETDERQTADEAARRVASVLKAEGAEDIRIDPGVPVVLAHFAASRLGAIERLTEAAGILFHDTSAHCDLNDSMTVSRVSLVQPITGLTGAGVKVAVFELGPDVVTDLSIAGSYSATPSTSDHSRLVHSIIKNVAPGQQQGYAPGCDLYSANDYDLDALRWATVTQGCTVVNQSFHGGSEETSSARSFQDMYKDWLVLHWPYPTIIQAAGNGAATEFVNHKGFNSLTVGSHDDTAAMMAGDSVFANPSSLNGDRELPEIAANGTAVTSVGLSMSGTSFASPAVAGTVALLQEADATLKSWPEGCRAIVLAAARPNVSDGPWFADVQSMTDGHDGSGALDAFESVGIARSRRAAGDPPSPRGWNIGTLRGSDLDPNGDTTYSYLIQAPRRVFRPHIKVALAWDGSPLVFDFPWSRSSGVVDLDLSIFDRRGRLVGYSGSFDNTYEIAEFDGTPGEDYIISIRRTSGSLDVWYGIAWTCRGMPWLDTTS